MSQRISGNTPVKWCFRPGIEGPGSAGLSPVLSGLRPASRRPYEGGVFRRFRPCVVVAAIAAALLAGCTTTVDPAASAATLVGGDGAAVRPRDAYVLLSGGGTPLSNNYSQYLQAAALAGWLQRDFPADATWIFFGMGNRDGVPPVLADVRRELKRDGRLVQSWLPGPLPHNRPATRDSVLRALRDEILPVVRGGGTLYLFVGDHGELGGTGDKRESAITLWQLKPGKRRAGNWTTDDDEVLGVAELRQVLAAGLGRGRVVFCMTQCHSGGFHELGVARDMTPPAAWFSARPSWLGKAAPGLLLPVAGFTATDQASPAAGCDADPDPERWAGYERFLPESLLGQDLMTGRPKGVAAVSFAAAHEAATLVDHTIDKPRATSEHYLEAWARLIETRLATTLAVTERTHRAVEGFQRAVDRGTAPAADPALRERQAQFARFTAGLVAQLPADAALLRNGTRPQLDSAIRGRGGRGGGSGGGGRRGALAEARRAWSETLRPAWKAAVAADEVAGLAPAVRNFEQHLLELEDKGRELLLPRGNNDTPLLNELYWKSGYATPATLDAARAGAVAAWGATRRDRIVAWGAASSDPRLRAAAEKIGSGPVLDEAPPTPLSRRTAAERILFYRRVLAAWEFLLVMEARGPLGELAALCALEATPVRK